jgi:hypothetical protein
MKSLVPVRPLIDAGGQALVLRAFLAVGEDEATVAIGAFDKAGTAHLQEHPGVAQGAADAVAGEAVRVNDQCLGRGPGDGR